MKSLLSLVFTLLSLIAYCQGEVNFTYSDNIDKMKQKFINDNNSSNEIKGWRIQIITTDDRRKMEQAINKFSVLYPGIEIKWNHMPPYYRVKVGAYENKMQLMGFLLDLKKDFPGVIPVVESIEKAELVRY